MKICAAQADLLHINIDEFGLFENSLKNCFENRVRFVEQQRTKGDSRPQLYIQNVLLCQLWRYLMPSFSQVEHNVEIV
jgi:hypothetical protein